MSIKQLEAMLRMPLDKLAASEKWPSYSLSTVLAFSMVLA
jgi:hypothetical protein